MIGNAGPGYQREQDVFIQSNTTNLFQAFLQTYDKEDITLTSDINIGDNIINVSTGHGITAGNQLIIYTSLYYWQVQVVSVAVDQITLEAPTTLPFIIADTTIIRGSCELAAASLNVDYKFELPGSNMEPIDINAALFIMGHSGQGDDSKFGDLTALTNGLLVQKLGPFAFNLGVYRENRSFRLNNGVIEYSDKAGGGNFGTNIKFKLQGQENFDSVIRLNYGDAVSVKRRDDLSGLSFFKISIIGNYTTGE